MQIFLWWRRAYLLTINKNYKNKMTRHFIHSLKIKKLLIYFTGAISFFEGNNKWKSKTLSYQTSNPIKTIRAKKENNQKEGEMMCLENQ